MNIANLRMVNQIVDEMAKLDRQIEAVANGNGLRVSIDCGGAYGQLVQQDEAIAALLRPVLLGELRARRRRCEADMKQLGVELY